MDLWAVGLDLVVSREAARCGVVQHATLDLAERPEHADEGKDLQLVDHRDPGLKLPFCFCSSRPRPSHSTGRTFTRPCLATSKHLLRVVAEESGHRDAAMFYLGVAEVAGGLAVVERPKQ